MNGSNRGCTRRSFARALAATAVLGVACAAPPAATSPAAPSPPAPPAPPVLPELHATIHSSRGEIRIRLMVRETPLTCANFVNLVQRGAYEHSAFHDWTRVIRQCGGPSQRFEPGYMIRREFNAKLMFDGPGKVAMQKAADGQHAHATQFFITVKEQSRWDLDIPIFAVVERGQGAVDAIQQGDAVERITIEGDAAPLLARFSKEVSEWNAALDRTLPRSAKSRP